MATFVIEGGHKLSGSITPQGAKNEALQVICAVLLTDEEVIISNIPDIRDVNKLIFILSELGVKVKQLEEHTYSFKADKINLKYLESDKFKRDGSSLRGSIMIVGPLLARFGKGYIPRPGGDKIGRRRLDTHFEGFIKLGATFRYNHDEKFYGVEASHLIGTSMLLEEASVTGTANIIMAAVLAEGVTSIYNAACEPYIQQLCRMLNSMGADISGVGSNLLHIKGVKKLKGCKHKILPDMIEIGSWIGMAAMTKSSLTIKDVSWADLGLIPTVFKKLGINLVQKGDDIFIPQQENYEIQNFMDGSILTIADAPWPGFTPDLLSIVLVVATQAKGSVLIHQKMFESRLFFVDKLIDMGAKVILCDPHRATVIGMNHESSLKGTTMTSPDIRAGISLLIAALSAKGTSTIHNIEQIDRGYENIDERLRAIGAKITRTEQCV
jgi:UDP-N-acetylglucosamine 1-carboxyvinyltransferase